MYPDMTNYARVGNETLCVCDATMISTAFKGERYMECPSHNPYVGTDDFFRVTRVGDVDAMVAPDEFLEFAQDSECGGAMEIEEFMDIFYEWLED